MFFAFVLVIIFYVYWEKMDLHLPVKAMVASMLDPTHDVFKRSFSTSSRIAMLSTPGEYTIIPHRTVVQKMANRTSQAKPPSIVCWFAI